MKEIFSAFLVFVFLLSLCGCGKNSQTNENLRKIIEENGYDEEIDVSSAKIVTSSSLPKDIDGLKNSENFTLLLVSSDNESITDYKICAVDFENKKMATFSYGDYFPLPVLAEEYTKYSPSRIQQQNFNIISTYIKKYGFNFTKDRSCTDAYIRRITGTNGFIPLSEAQGIIDGIIEDFFPGSSSYDHIEAVFEEGSAVINSYKCISEVDGEDLITVLDRDYNTLYTSYGDEITEIIDDEEYVYDEYRFVEEDEHPEGTEIEEIPDSDGTTMYRVRKSASDASSQLGAFSDYNNAVNLAKSKKNEGYKVFDSNGKLVYTP